MTVSVGVDVGGTFTDFILIDTERQDFRMAKVPTTVDDRSRGFLQGIDALDIAPAAIDSLTHGTTAGTNAVLERTGAQCGLLTTKGFRDVLEIGRRTRPQPYGLSGSFQPLIERRFRLEIDERLDAAGAVVTPLDKDEVRSQALKLLELGCEAVVVMFLHSYVNTDHEARAVAIVREIWPNEHVVASHEVVREIREFERASTAVIHASISPVVSEYITDVATQLKNRGYDKELMIMQANGGMMASSLVSKNAVQTVMSGPAAGVLAAAVIAKQAGLHNLVTGDMGGTSFDVAVIVEGTPVISAEKDLAYGVPIRVPMIDIHTVSAGGGSIAHIDKAGMVRVGPESAASFPGPIGFGRGGLKPTITDANFLLGRLNPSSITGSQTEAPLDKIAVAFGREIGDKLGYDSVETAAAILRVANAELAAAMRLVLIEQGHDPRDFAFMPFGGAGPLHAIAIARELNIPTVIVPKHPGLNSALGCVLADVRHDFVQSVNQILNGLDVAFVQGIMDMQAAEGRQLLEQEKVDVVDVVVKHEFDMLFKGQSHSIRVEFEGRNFDPAVLLKSFFKRYYERYRLDLPEMHPVLANVRTMVTGIRETIDLGIFRPNGKEIGAARKGSRRVYFDGDWLETPIFDRIALPVGAEIKGPAIFEQLDTTFVLDPGAHARVDEFGNLIATVGR